MESVLSALLFGECILIKIDVGLARDEVHVGLKRGRAYRVHVSLV